jgi:hypothetical protein
MCKVFENELYHSGKTLFLPAKYVLLTVGHPAIQLCQQNPHDFLFSSL